jgi:hypothetical protein
MTGSKWLAAAFIASGMVACGPAQQEVADGEQPQQAEVPSNEELGTSQSALTASLEGEDFSVVSGSQTNGTYGGRYVRAFWTAGRAGAYFYSDVAKSTTINIYAYGTSCGGDTPMLSWQLGNQGGVITSTPTSFSSLTWPIKVAAGWNYLEISMSGDYNVPGVCDRNLFVDWVHIWS